MRASPPTITRVPISTFDTVKEDSNRKAASARRKKHSNHIISKNKHLIKEVTTSAGLNYQIYSQMVTDFPTKTGRIQNKHVVPNLISGPTMSISDESLSVKKLVHTITLLDLCKSHCIFQTPRVAILMEVLYEQGRI